MARVVVRAWLGLMAAAEAAPAIARVATIPVNFIVAVFAKRSDWLLKRSVWSWRTRDANGQLALEKNDCLVEETRGSAGWQAGGLYTLDHNDRQ